MSALLPIRQVEKPWGCEQLPAPFQALAGQRIGEIWFEPPPELPQLLVKYIFTSEALSVQVHPSDVQAMAAGLGRQGKEECWLIVDAQPGARLGIGFDVPLDAEAMRAAALDGSIERLMTWHPVQPGDFFHIPANTVHAIGAGVGLIEVQQASDVTYRLYDYGRPRELHLDEAIAVARGAPYDPLLRQQVPATGHKALLDGPLFRLDQVTGPLPAEVSGRYAGAPLLVIPRDAPVRIAGEVIVPGQCGAAQDVGQLHFSDAGTCLLAQPRA